MTPSNTDKELIDSMDKDEFLNFLKVLKVANDHVSYVDFEKMMRVGIYSEKNIRQFLENELEQLEQFKPENQDLLVFYGLEKFGLLNEMEEYYFEYYMSLIAEHQKKIEWIKNEMDKLPKPQKEEKPIELSDFLNNEEYRDKLPLIVKKIGSYTGKKMATAIGALLEMKVLVHGRREFKDLATTINPKLTSTNLGLIRSYLNPNEPNKVLDDDEIERFKRWVSSL